MQALLTVLRLVHIFSGVYWVGAAAFMTLMVGPLIPKLGPAGPAFMRGLLQERPFSQSMSITAVLTVLSGIWMFWIVSGGFQASWFSRTGAIVLTVGAVAGILAAVHGGGVLAPRQSRVGELGEQIAAAGGPPSPEQLASIQAAQADVRQHTLISLGLMIIALAGMASARYL